MLREYRLPYREWRRVSRRAYAAQQRDQSEVAGLIAVGRHREIRLEFVRNESDRPCHFEFGWDQFLRARAVIRASGHRYLGMFHSHPISEAIPGRGDLRGARVNSVVLIYDVCGTNARLWRIVKLARKKQAIEIPLVIERSPRGRVLSGDFAHAE